MRSFKRSNRLSDQIRRDISEIVSEILRDKSDVMVTISDVDVSKDLKRAKIFYTVLGGDNKRDEIENIFALRIGFIQSELAQRLRIRRVPEISFHYDQSLVDGMKISDLIDHVVAEDKKNFNPADVLEPDTIDDIIAALKKPKHVLIVGHAGPDGDSLGSQLALGSLLNSLDVNYEIVNEGPIPDNYKFLPGIELVQNIDDYQLPEEAFDTIVYIECSDTDRIGDVSRIIQGDYNVINIDHHGDNKKFGDINYVNEKATAAGEIIYDIYSHGNIELTKSAAINLYTAILTDTGRFYYNNTTSRSLHIAANLIDKGIDVTEITDRIYYNLTRPAINLIGHSLLNLEFHGHNQICFMTLTKELLQKTGASKKDTEGLVNHSMSISGVIIGVLFTERDDNSTKVSFRSHNSIDIINIASKFNGGGHRIACGCVIDSALSEAKNIILDEIKEFLDEPV